MGDVDNDGFQPLRRVVEGDQVILVVWFRRFG